MGGIPENMTNILLNNVCVVAGPFPLIIQVAAMVGIRICYLAGFRSRRFLDGVRVGILRVLGVGIFDPTPTPKVQLN